MPFCVIVLIASVWTMTGCGNVGLQIQAQTADSVAEAANTALPILIDRYRDDGFRVLERVKADGGNADDARAAIEKVKVKWKPIWDAWEALRVAQDAWATSLESGGDSAAALGALKKACCDLRAVWPEDIPAVPLAPLRCAK